MPGANWTAKDYEAIADITGEILKNKAFRLEYESLIILEIITAGCQANAKFGINGNRNFKEDYFRNQCLKRAGLYNEGKGK